MKSKDADWATRHHFDVIMSGALQAKSLGWLSLKIVPLDSQCIYNATSAPRCRPRLLFLYLYSVNGASSFVGFHHFSNLNLNRQNGVWSTRPKTKLAQYQLGPKPTRPTFWTNSAQNQVGPKPTRPIFSSFFSLFLLSFLFFSFLISFLFFLFFFLEALIGSCSLHCKKKKLKKKKKSVKYGHPICPPITVKSTVNLL